MAGRGSLRAVPIAQGRPVRTQLNMLPLATAVPNLLTNSVKCGPYSSPAVGMQIVFQCITAACGKWQ